MSPYRRNVLVGAVVLVGLGMLAWMILKFANRAADFFLTSGTHIKLKTQHAQGVGEGSPVTYKGVYVGRVTGVHRVARTTADRDSEDVIIDAVIEATPPVPAYVRGKIRQTSLLGASATISLEPDEESFERLPMTGRRHLTEGAQIDADYVPGITELGDNVRGLADSMQQTVNSLNNLLDDPKMQEDIKATLANARATMESANRIAARVEKLTGEFDQVVKDTQGTMKSVRETVQDGRAELLKVSGNLNQRIDQLAESLQRVQSVARKIDEGKGTAGALVNDPKLYESLADTAAELNLMVKDMRRLIQQWEQEGIVKF